MKEMSSTIAMLEDDLRGPAHGVPGVTGGEVINEVDDLMGGRHQHSLHFCQFNMMFLVLLLSSLINGCSLICYFNYW